MWMHNSNNNNVNVLTRVMIIVTNGFWEGHIKSLKCIFNCGPKFRGLLNTFSLNLSEAPCEESIGFQNRPSLAITQQDQRHASAARESTSNVRVPVCQHLSLSGLYYRSSRFSFQTYTSSHSWPCCIWPLQQSSSLYHVRLGEFIHCFSLSSQSFAHCKPKLFTLQIWGCSWRRKGRRKV